MKCLIISAAHSWPEEQAQVQALFRAGMPRFHLRKPDWNADMVQDFLSGFSASWLKKTIWHGPPEFVQGLALGGLHIPGWLRQQWKPKQWNACWSYCQYQNMSLSSSMHSLEELETDLPMDYVLLSPVFESLSKPGYKGRQEWILKKRYPFEVFGLGGVHADNLKELKDRGFQGFACLGAIWNAPEKSLENFHALLLASSNINHPLQATK